MRYTVQLLQTTFHDRWRIVDNGDNDLVVAFSNDEKMALHIAALLNIDVEKNEKLEQEKRIGISPHAETP